MSSLYEKSIADARELRNIALKNAETIVLEQYSEKVKEAVKSILEKEDDEGLPMSPDQPGPDDLMLGGGGGEEAAAEMPPLPPEAAGLGDEKEDLGELEGLPNSASEGGDEEITLTINLDDMSVEDGEAVGSAELRLDLGELEKLLGQEEDEMLGDEMLDRDETLGGGLEEPAEEEPEDSLELTEEGLARLDKKNEENSVLQEANENNKLLLAEVKRNKEKVSLLTEKVAKYEETMNILKEELDTVTVSGAKLLYSNRVLQDSSLNERQKEKLVKSIKETRSMQEARAIYEALQSTVGSAASSGRPESLSEAVEKRSSNRLLVRESKQVKPAISRMQRLAGIK